MSKPLGVLWFDPSDNPQTFLKTLKGIKARTLKELKETRALKELKEARTLKESKETRTSEVSMEARTLKKRKEADPD